MFAKSPRLISFALGATFDTIASPVNKKRWGLCEKGTCDLCGKDWCDVKHVLSGCAVALAQGRYRYRHDAVLRQISHGLAQAINIINNSKGQKKKKKSINIPFVQAGQRVKNSCKGPEGLLLEAKD